MQLFTRLLDCAIGYYTTVWYTILYYDAEYNTILNTLLYYSVLHYAMLAIVYYTIQ